MSNTKTLGGDRLGSGNKQQVTLHGFERSTHDLSYVWRSTMASGTLVPFMSEVALPGDNFEIDLTTEVMTHPTIGPLFGSYKVQLDVFQCPVRLYNGKLHMNMLNIGLNMQSIKLPQIKLTASVDEQAIDEQINPSCIFSYLNIRGLAGWNGTSDIEREFNAIPYLGYWDIYKNYYSNKQEEVGAVIHNPQSVATNGILNMQLYALDGSYGIGSYGSGGTPFTTIWTDSTLRIYFENSTEPTSTEINEIEILDGGTLDALYATTSWHTDGVSHYLLLEDYIGTAEFECLGYMDYRSGSAPDDKPKITFFPLSNIDQMREDILTATQQATPFIIDGSSWAPYGLPIQKGNYAPRPYSKQSVQEGLGLKTYQSDLFNNWISTEWIDGDNGINSITSVDTSSGSFTIDTLQLSRKVYDMLNRIAVSGGTYDDWLDAVYTHERTRSVENPIYHGGLIKELAFQEVISNAAAQADAETTQPLGTLAGRGVLTQKHKGGKVNIRVDEPSYIIGIVSLTPRIDYSQGNKWDVNLKTMDDFHKPSLDEIGFQDLITDQMSFYDTKIDEFGNPVYKSAGKQPAWVNYMTNVNRCYGNFAIAEGTPNAEGQMYMTLNRKYDVDPSLGIKDLTTYVDPSKFNHIFADTRLDAQNFWTQIGVNIKARRKMSAKLMPNL